MEEVSREMTGFQWLERALRKHGFLGGVVTGKDEGVIDALLSDIRDRLATLSGAQGGDDALLRVQTALERRVSAYATKARICDPFAEPTENVHDRYAFALGCFEVFAHEAGLRWPVEQEVPLPKDSQVS